jgi:hypothetical protein
LSSLVFVVFMEFLVGETTIGVVPYGTDVVFFSRYRS